MKNHKLKQHPNTKPNHPQPKPKLIQSAQPIHQPTAPPLSSSPIPQFLLPPSPPMSQCLINNFNGES